MVKEIAESETVLSQLPVMEYKTSFVLQTKGWIIYLYHFSSQLYC